MSAGRRRALVLVLALVAAGVLTGGVVSASDLRAEAVAERERLAAARAEAEAQEAYRVVVGRASAALYDQLQPLQAALQRASDAEPVAGPVARDVARHLVKGDGLEPVRTLLTATEPPASRQDVQKGLLSALDEIAAAVKKVSAVSDDDVEDFNALITGDLDLDAATRDFATPLVPVFRGAEPPLQPTTIGNTTMRRPLSHASYLFDAGTVCAASIATLDERLGDDPSSEKYLQVTADVFDRDVPRLLAVKAPTADDPRVGESIRGPLRTTKELGVAARTLLGAAGRRDASAARAAQRRLLKASAAAVKAGRGYRDYGSETCSVLFIGFEDDEGAEDEGDEGRPA